MRSCKGLLVTLTLTLAEVILSLASTMIHEVVEIAEQKDEMSKAS